MASLHKNIQLMLEFLKAPLLVLHFFYYTLIDLSDEFICDFTINVGDNTLYTKCDQASDLWQQLELTSELESSPGNTVDWGKKWLVDFNAGKTQLVSFDRSNNTSSIDVKMDGSIIFMVMILC